MFELNLKLDGRSLQELQDVLEREIEVMWDTYREDELLEPSNWYMFRMFNVVVDQMEEQVLWEEREYAPGSRFMEGRRFFVHNYRPEGKVEEVEYTLTPLEDTRGALRVEEVVDQDTLPLLEFDGELELELEEDEEDGKFEIDVTLTEKEVVPGLEVDYIQEEIKNITWDYGLYVGNLVSSERYTHLRLKPQSYVELTMGEGEGMTQLGTIGFLKQYIPLGEAIDWVNENIHWWGF